MATQGVGSTLEHDSVLIGAAASVIKAAKSTRKSIVIQNAHATQILYIGGAGVTTATGLRVAAGASVTLDDYNGVLYGIASGANTDVRYLEVS
jgi:hypothetical protein